MHSVVYKDVTFDPRYDSAVYLPRHASSRDKQLQQSNDVRGGAVL